MRVLLIAPQPFFAQRGTPINVRQMVQTLCEAGHEVHLATYPMGEPVQIAGLHLHRAMRVPGLRTVPIGFSWRKVVLDVSLALRVWALIAGRRFDVVHAVEESVFFALPAARLRGIPVIYDLDSWMSDQLAYGGRVQNGALLAIARTLGARRAIVYTGNLESYQGIDLLLDAFAKVSTARPEAVLVLVGGSSSQVETVRARAAALGIGDRVVLTGHRPAEEMPGWMALGDVLVSPRLHGDNTPLKIYSYMWSAVPIVATDRPTHTQVLDARTAVLRAATPAAFATGILDVLADPERFAALGVAARARVASDYSRDAFRRKLLAAYASILPAVRSSVATSM